MEKRSTHYGDIAKWIEKVINSCVTYEQVKTADKLIINFENQLNRKLGGGYYSNIILPLQSLLSFKINQIQENYFK